MKLKRILYFLLTGSIAFVLILLFITTTFSQKNNSSDNGDNFFIRDHREPGELAIIQDQLTKGQRIELDNAVAQLREAGKSHREIKVAVDALLSSWGIEIPEPPHGPFGGGFMEQLTDEQRAELDNTVKQLRDAGKTHDEIRTATDELFAKWGIERPEPPHGPGGGFMEQLTEEQRAELDNIVKQLQDAGMTHDEIQTATDELLEKWGIERPEPPLPRLK